MTKEKFKDGIGLLADGFLKTLQPRTLDAYWEVVSDLTDAEFETARARALRECDFMPAPGKLLELAGQRREGPDEWAHMRFEPKS